MQHLPGSDPAVARWLTALEERHLRELTFPEVRRALQALSALYVEGRHRLAKGEALDGRGKRAAFALFYGPLHFATTADVLRELAPTPPPRRILDLGCGTGAAGAAWALTCGAEVVGIDPSGWALQESAWTWRALGLRGTARRGRMEEVEPRKGDAVVAGWSVNELDDAGRDALLPRLLDAGARGSRVLVLEPIARKPVPWWDAWSRAFTSAGGRDDAWRFRGAPPAIVARLSQAAGLDHRERTARTLAL